MKQLRHSFTSFGKFGYWFAALLLLFMALSPPVASQRRTQPAADRAIEQKINALIAREVKSRGGAVSKIVVVPKAAGNETAEARRPLRSGTTSSRSETSRRLERSNAGAALRAWSADHNRQSSSRPGS